MRHIRIGEKMTGGRARGLHRGERVRVKKRANENEVVSSSATFVAPPRRPSPHFYTRFLRSPRCFLSARSRTFAGWELTLHACVTFNFRHNFLALPSGRRFSSFNDANPPRLAARTTHL